MHRLPGHRKCPLMLNVNIKLKTLHAYLSSTLNEHPNVVLYGADLLSCCTLQNTKWGTALKNTTR